MQYNVLYASKYIMLHSIMTNFIYGSIRCVHISVHFLNILWCVVSGSCCSFKVNCNCDMSSNVCNLINNCYLKKLKSWNNLFWLFSNITLFHYSYSEVFLQILKLSSLFFRGSTLWSTVLEKEIVLC